MIPHAVTIGDITAEQLALFRRVCDRLLELPDGLDCHEVCAALAAPPLRTVRGYFLFRGYPHSWLAVEGSQTIIDPYPWTGASPLLLTLEGTLNPWRWLYVPAAAGRSPLVLVDRVRYTRLLKGVLWGSRPGTGLPEQAKELLRDLDDRTELVPPGGDVDAG